MAVDRAVVSEVLEAAEVEEHWQQTLGRHSRCSELVSSYSHDVCAPIIIHRAQRAPPRQIPTSATCAPTYLWTWLAALTIAAAAVLVLWQPRTRTSVYLVVWQRWEVVDRRVGAARAIGTCSSIVTRLRQKWRGPLPEGRLLNRYRDIYSLWNNWTRIVSLFLFTWLIDSYPQVIRYRLQQRVKTVRDCRCDNKQTPVFRW